MLRCAVVRYRRKKGRLLIQDYAVLKRLNIGKIQRLYAGDWLARGHSEEPSKIKAKKSRKGSGSFHHSPGIRVYFFLI
jgi:hypothetical protein